MSVRVLTWAFKQTGLRPSEKAVLIALADYASDAGVAWPGHKALAEKTALSMRSVIRAQNVLSEKKLVSIEHQYKHGKQITNVYYLSFSVPKKKPPKSSVGVTQCHGVGDTVTLGGVTQCHTNHHVNRHENRHEKIPPRRKLETAMNVSDTLREKKEAQPSDEEILAEKKAYIVYSRTHKKYLHGIWIGEYTLKQLSQLKLIEKRGGENVPLVVFTVVSNWSAFVSYVETNTEAYKVPRIPNIPILLKYIESAVQFTQEMQLVAQVTKTPKKHLTKTTQLAYSNAEPNMALLDVFAEGEDVSNGG